MRAVRSWREGTAGEPIVRISAGNWTSAFLARNIGALWQPDDHFRIEFVTAYAKVDIGRRNADIGVRSDRPTEQWLAGRRVAVGRARRKQQRTRRQYPDFQGPASRESLRLLHRESG